ncbi:DGAT1/2-independent enzyme synthesizing storage lipids [Oratosquilla oratoria]|uniref:DGAT1/2-independent enzyme synthesizing storage lipids n=1 Tax=Oratosquilla oratoria TaxID=337810 RepID=UPI003F7589DD
MNCADPESLCAAVINATAAAKDFINSQLDLLYLAWVWSLLYPLILVVVVLPLIILMLLYLSAFMLYLYRRRNRIYDVIHETYEHGDPWVGGRYLVSILWDAHGYVWHGYDVEGLEHIPLKGPALIIYYHGAIPLDCYYLVTRTILARNRLIRCVGDNFLEKVPGWKVMLEAFHVTPGTVSGCVKTLSRGHILAISPGGVREAQFSDHNYQLMWGKRTGYAKVAVESKAPVIPMFTENVREAFRTVSWPQALWRTIYEKTRLPCAPIYGGFPVKLRTHLGKPVLAMPGETAEELAVRVETALQELINKHQRLPGNIFRALLARVYEKPKKS